MEYPLIYDFAESGLYYDQQVIYNEPFFYLALGDYTLSLWCALSDGGIMRATDYLPLNRAIRCSLAIGDYVEGRVCIGGLNEEDYCCGATYRSKEWYPEINKYFAQGLLKFDKNAGIIFMGTKLDNIDRIVKVNANIFCGLDPAEVLKCIYIVPDLILHSELDISK